MVQCDDGYRDRISAVRRHSVRGRVAVLACCSLPWVKQHSIRLRLHHFLPPIHPIPGNMDRHDCRQYQFALPWNDTYGIRNIDFCLVHTMYPVLGILGHNTCLGLLDHRLGGICHRDNLIDCHVNIRN